LRATKKKRQKYCVPFQSEQFIDPQEESQLLEDLFFAIANAQNPVKAASKPEVATSTANESSSSSSSDLSTNSFGSADFRSQFHENFTLNFFVVKFLAKLFAT